MVFRTIGIRIIEVLLYIPLALAFGWISATGGNRLTAGIRSANGWLALSANLDGYR